MVDCAEGTLRQFALQQSAGKARLRADRVAKIFITHLHCKLPLAPIQVTSDKLDIFIDAVDHTMGIITLLASILRGGAGTPQPPRTKPVCQLLMYSSCHELIEAA